MIFQLTVALCIGNGLVSAVTFFLYLKARTADRTDPGDRTAEQQTIHLTRLDRQERRYQSLHFITLSLFVLFGVLILIQLSHRFNPEHIY